MSDSVDHREKAVWVTTADLPDALPGETGEQYTFRKQLEQGSSFVIESIGVIQSLAKISEKARKHIPEDYFEVTAGVVAEQDLLWDLTEQAFMPIDWPIFQDRMFYEFHLVIRPKRAR